jgi:hypothetical protein
MKYINDNKAELKKSLPVKTAYQLITAFAANANGSSEFWLILEDFFTLALQREQQLSEGGQH